MLHSPNDALLPLRDKRNNVISPFPGTPRAIEGLRGLSNADIYDANLRLTVLIVRDVDTILEGLGSERDGSLNDKKTKLRLLVGLRTDTA